MFVALCDMLSLTYASAKDNFPFYEILMDNKVIWVWILEIVKMRDKVLKNNSGFIQEANITELNLSTN